MNKKSSSPPGLAVSYRWQLAIYLILPLCIVAYVLDVWIMKGHLRDTLTRAPEAFFVLSLFFGTPHIIASNVILIANAEYIHHYWKKAVIATLFIIAFFAIFANVLPYEVIFAIVATITIVHVLRQQIGIVRALAGLKGWIYQT